MDRGHLSPEQHQDRGDHHRQVQQTITQAEPPVIGSLADHGGGQERFDAFFDDLIGRTGPIEAPDMVGIAGAFRLAHAQKEGLEAEKSRPIRLLPPSRST